MTTPTRPLLAALATVAVVAVAGCGSGSDTTAPPAASNTTTKPANPAAQTSTGAQDGTADMAGMAMISIDNFMYSGAAEVKPGELVMVTNDDGEAHTLTADMSGSFMVTIAPSGTATFHAPTKPGRYTFHCDLHSQMHGSLIVK
jgi:plastocyanin